MKAIETSEEHLHPYFRDVAKLMTTTNRLELNAHLFSWISAEELTLPHPIHHSDSATLRSNSLIKNGNILFFRGSSQSTRFAIIQIYNFIDAIWCEDGWFFLPEEEYSKALCQNLSTKLNRGIYNDSFEKPARPSAIYLNHLRPAHFLFDQLTNVVSLLNSNRRIRLAQGTLFLSILDKGFDHLIELADAEDPQLNLILPNSVIANKYSRELWQSFTQPRSSAGNTTINNQLRDRSFIRVWFGCSSMKKSWLEQVDACELLVRKLTNLGFKDIEILTDGITSPIDTQLSSEAEFEIANQIKHRLAGKAEVRSLIGLTYEQKLELGETCAGFICAAGTPSIVPNLALQLPGVIHSNPSYWYEEDIKFNPRAAYVDFQHVKAVANTSRTMDFTSYSLAPEHVCELFFSQVLNL